MTEHYFSIGHGLLSCLWNGKATIGTASLANDAKETRWQTFAARSVILSSSDKSTMGTADRITLKETRWQNFTLQPYKYVLSCPRAMKKVMSQTADRMTCIYIYIYIYIYMDEITDQGAGIAQWLEHRTRDWKVAGSNPCWNGGRIFFSRVDFLCWLLFRYPFHPRVTTVARKKSRSFCQKCRWQVTAKHAYTLRMWILLNRASALVTTCP